MAKYNSYTDEEREQVAELLQEGLSAAEISRRLTIPERTIRQWRADWRIQPQRRSPGKSDTGQASHPTISKAESGDRPKPWKIALLIAAVFVAPPLAAALFRRS